MASTVASLAATACYNYFFLPPVGTFTIADPANWVALATFLLASVVVSRLVTRAQRRAAEADARRAEIEALYDLSIDLFTATNRVGALGEAAGKALKTLGARAGGLVLFRDGADRADIVGVMGENALESDDPLVETVGRRGETAEVPAEGGARDVYLPVAVGGKTSGVLVVRGTRADRSALESVGRLVALAVERERFLAERAHLDALRESDALKTSLLRAVSHDLRTPMTAIRMGLDALRRGGPDEATCARRWTSWRGDRAALTADRQSPRDGAARRRHLRAAPRAHSCGRPVSPRDREPSSRARGRPLEIHVDPNCPDLFVDPALALEILANFLENAARAAPPIGRWSSAPSPAPWTPCRVWLEVLDRGPGVSAAIKSKAAGPLVRRDSGAAVWASRSAAPSPAPWVGALPFSTGRVVGQSPGSTFPRRRPRGHDPSPVFPAHPRGGRRPGHPPDARRGALGRGLRDHGGAGRRRGPAPVRERRAGAASHGPGHARVGRVRPHRGGPKARQTPILVLSVRAGDTDKIRALDLGADDYVVKPFSVQELLARVRAQLRRSLDEDAPAPLEFPGLTIDRERRRVVQDEREIRLTPTEFAILELLATHAGKPVTIRQIIGRVWHGAAGTTPDAVRVHVGSLRSKIEPDPSRPRYVVTEPWIGYRFVAEPL